MLNTDYVLLLLKMNSIILLKIKYGYGVILFSQEKKFNYRFSGNQNYSYLVSIYFNFVQHLDLVSKPSI